MCVLKLRTKGGKTTIINTYAPHGGYDYAVRQQYSTHLAEVFQTCSAYGMKMVVGDLNSRIHNDVGGEDEIFGPYCFGDPAYDPSGHTNTNRDLLLEFCLTTGTCVANTFVDNEVERRVTYHELWQNPLSNITHSGFQQLDLLLVARDQLWQIRQLCSDRWEALASHHFLLEVVVEFGTDSCETKETSSNLRKPRYNLSALRDKEIRDEFVCRYRELEQQAQIDMIGPDEYNANLCGIFHKAAADTLPKAEASPQRHKRCQRSCQTQPY